MSAISSVLPVTLHVSVWVEISTYAVYLKRSGVTLHVSVWVEMLQRSLHSRCFLSRSTWACELKFSVYTFHCQKIRHAPRERVSWNCIFWNTIVYSKCHAPRERVSWNYSKACEILYGICHAPRERVSWNEKSVIKDGVEQVTLHVSVWVEISVLWFSQWLYAVTLHVSVWVEIKVKKWKEVNYNVTLHVSVWVEMENSTNKRRIRMSRSTWACELKYTLMLKCFLWAGHAPRERVSWNV